MTRVYESNAWPSNASIIPPDTKLPCCNANDDRSYFYIRIVADFGTYLIDKEGRYYGLPTHTLEQAEHVKGFKIPADDLVHEGTSSSTISSMLSAMEIPEEAHQEVADQIGHVARDMAKNVGIKVMPMIVHIYVEDYFDDDGSGGEEDIDDSVSEDEDEEEAVSEEAVDHGEP